jgi:hypothetical protein
MKNKYVPIMTVLASILITAAIIVLGLNYKLHRQAVSPTRLTAEEQIKLAKEMNKPMTLLINPSIVSPGCKTYYEILRLKKIVSLKYDIPELERRLDDLLALVSDYRQQEIEAGLCKDVIDQLKEEFAGANINWADIYQKEPALFKERR